MIAQKDSYIRSAYQQLQIISQDKQKRLEYEAREKAVRDHNQMMYEAKESGKKEGIEIGKFDKSIQIAKNMLQKGLTINIIAEVTGLSLVEIEALQLKQTT